MAKYNPADIHFRLFVVAIRRARAADFADADVQYDNAANAQTFARLQSKFPWADVRIGGGLFAARIFLQGKFYNRSSGNGRRAISDFAVGVENF